MARRGMAGQRAPLDPQPRWLDRRRRHRPRGGRGQAAAADLLASLRRRMAIRGPSTSRSMRTGRCTSSATARADGGPGREIRSTSSTGCIDVDIRATPFTNTLPIRRLALQPGESRDLRMAFIDVPGLDVRPSTSAIRVSRRPFMVASIASSRARFRPICPSIATVSSSTIRAAGGGPSSSTARD